jgi:hypothetical protein
MAVKPVLKVEIDFASGASFAYPLILDDGAYGILDTNILGDQPADIRDVSDMVMKVSTRRGRNRILSNFEAGSATVVINDPESWFNPQNSASPFWDPETDSSKVLPLRKIRIYAITEEDGNPVEVNLFSGYIITYDTGFYDGVYTTSMVTLQCVDGFRLLNNVSTGDAPVPGCTTPQLSGIRVQQLLNFAGFPASMRNTFAGQSTMQADPGGARSILAAIQTVEQSEFGAFFMQRNGRTLYLDRYNVIERADVPTRVYSDTGDLGSFPYQQIDFAYDDQLILNDVTVTRYAPNGTVPAPVPQQVTDIPSIAKFFTKSGQRTGILVQTDQEANDQARTLLASRKNADLRIDSITLNNYADISELNLIVNLNSDIYNLIFVRKEMSGGSTIEKELFVQGVQHDITANTWTTKLFTSEPLIQGFILGSELQGILGDTVPQNTNTLSY